MLGKFGKDISVCLSEHFFLQRVENLQLDLCMREISQHLNNRNNREAEPTSMEHKIER
jgi:hypothetical protein